MNKINFFVVDDFNHYLLNKASFLHIEHLSYRGFITQFGSQFISELYKDILKNDLGFFAFAVEQDRIAGFVLGCTKSEKLFKITKNLKYFKIILPKIIQKPKLIFRIFETLFYNKKENTEVKAELIVIIADSNFRSKGIGSRLVNILNKEFLKRGISEYKVTVHNEMKKANNFYIKNGMKYSTNFNMYGVKWNLYVNNLISNA